MKIAHLTIGTAFMVGTLISPALWLGEIEQRPHDGVNIQAKSNNKPVVTIRVAQVENFNTSRSNVSSATLTGDKECAKNNKKKDKNCAPGKPQDGANVQARILNKPVPTGPVISIESHNSGRSNKSNATLTVDEGCAKYNKKKDKIRCLKNKKDTPKKKPAE